jgi:putative ABC transport system substrate-binding protein
VTSRLLVGLLVIIFLICAPPATAQQAKIHRIGYLSTRPTTLDTGRREAIQQALRALGYAEGQNIAIVYRNTEGDSARNGPLLAELVRLKVDMIIAAGGSGLILAAKKATNTIPVVMAGEGLDPVEAGIIDSLARPGGNITGFTNMGGYLGGKRLELLKDALPKLRRVAVLYEANNTRNMFEFKEVLPASAQALKLTMLRYEVRNANEFEKVFAAINKDRPDGISVLGGPLLNRTQDRSAALANKSRLPSMYDSRNAMDVGALMYYGADIEESYQRVAAFVDKIIRGRKPADLPVEQPTRFELVVNLKTAKQIGVNIDPNLLARAQKIIR